MAKQKLSETILVHSVSYPSEFSESLSEENYLILWACSVISLTKYNKLILFGDKKAIDVAKKLAFNYTEFIDKCPEGSYVTACLSSMKYFYSNKNYLFIDNDIISTKDFNNIKEDCIVQGLEYTKGLLWRNFITFEQKYEDISGLELFVNKDDNSIKAYNAGVIQLKDKRLRFNYIDNWEKHIEHNRKYNAFVEKDFVFGIHVEQVHLYSFIHEYRGRYSVHEVNKTYKEDPFLIQSLEAIKYDFFHPVGWYKNQDFVQKDVRKYLEMNDFATFQLIKKCF